MHKTIFLLVAFHLCSRCCNAQSGWYEQLPYAGFGAPGTIYAMQFITDDFGVAVGHDGFFMRTTNGGESWTELNRVSTVDLRGVFFTSIENGIVVGDSGVIRRTTNGGVSWSIQNSSTISDLRGVCFLNATSGIIVGEGGGQATILRTTDAGATWAHQTSNTSRDLFSVSFSVTDPYRVMAVGESANYSQSRDGGLNWTRGNAGGTTPLTAVVMITDLIAIAVGMEGRMYRTSDFGASWTRLDRVTLSHLHSVHFSDDRNGVAVGNSGIIIRTTDSGITWAVQTGPTKHHLYATYSTSSSVGFAAGYGRIVLHTTTGGTTSVKEVYDPSPGPLIQQNFPNPARDITTFRFKVPAQRAVLLDIVDALGNIVAVVVNEVMNEGSYEATLDVGTIPTGAYHVRMQMNGQQQTTSLVVVR